MKFRNSFLVIACSALLATSLIALPLTISPAATMQCWSCVSDQDRNNLIVNRARAEIGKWYNPGTPQSPGPGSCKNWIRSVVLWAGGPSLPANFTDCSVDPTYCFARWFDSQHIVIWQGAYYCPASFNHGIVPGNIIQMRLNTGPHTGMVESLSSTTMTWIDCNFVASGTVGRHTIDLSWWAGHVTAWTVYQIK